MDGSPNSNSAFLSLWFERSDWQRALKVALVVGIALTIINLGDQNWTGIIPPIWKILLIYLVPYFVSSYADAQAGKGE